MTTSTKEKMKSKSVSGVYCLFTLWFCHWVNGCEAKKSFFSPITFGNELRIYDVVPFTVFFSTHTVRSGAEERTFGGARLDVLIFRLRSYHILISYSAACSGRKFHTTLMFLGQAGTFLSFQARRSSATHSSTSDLTVVKYYM